MAKIADSMTEQILHLAGGRNNILVCGNCMTRLHLTLLKDQDLVLWQ